MKIRKIKPFGILTGLCAGIAYAIGIQTWIVRLAAVFICAGSNPFLFIGFYLAMSIIVPTWEEVPSNFDIHPALKDKDSSCEKRMPALKYVDSRIHIPITTCATDTSPYSYSKSCSSFRACEGMTG